jgi:hypothetical protein
MTLVVVRKTSVQVEEVWHEGGPRLAKPLLLVTAAAVVRNPYAGTYESQLMSYMAELRALGTELSLRAIMAVGGPERVEAYGKGAIVGEDGELEHGALWHEAGGWALREQLNGAKAIVPASKCVGTLGSRLVVPLGHIRAAYVRSHFNAADLSIWDAPRRQEIVYAICVASGSRVHARSGGLSASAIVGEDGQR